MVFHRRVSPFGYRWFDACTRLPSAFRSVPRPSSAPDTQASPVCLVSLVFLSCGDTAPLARPIGTFRVSGPAIPQLGAAVGLPFFCLVVDKVLGLDLVDMRIWTYSILKVLLTDYCQPGYWLLAIGL